MITSSLPKLIVARLLALLAVEVGDGVDINEGGTNPSGRVSGKDVINASRSATRRVRVS